jgi:uncharacterized membrane protein YqhA
MHNNFEKGLWLSRYIVILTVVLSILASFSLILIASWDIVEAITIYNPLFSKGIDDNNQFLFKIISSIDLFLIGIVLLIFGFGVYELFVKEINFAKARFIESTLQIKNLDQLKNKIIKVVIIVLIVKYFEKILKLSQNFTSPLDILYFSISILCICFGYYFINKK